MRLTDHRSNEYIQHGSPYIQGCCNRVIVILTTIYTGSIWIIHPIRRPRPRWHLHLLWLRIHSISFQYYFGIICWHLFVSHTHTYIIYITKCIYFWRFKFAYRYLLTTSYFLLLFYEEQGGCCMRVLLDIYGTATKQEITLIYPFKLCFSTLDPPPWDLPIAYS